MLRELKEALELRDKMLEVYRDGLAVKQVALMPLGLSFLALGFAPLPVKALLLLSSGLSASAYWLHVTEEARRLKVKLFWKPLMGAREMDAVITSLEGNPQMRSILQIVNAFGEEAAIYLSEESPRYFLGLMKEIQAVDGYLGRQRDLADRGKLQLTTADMHNVWEARIAEMREVYFRGTIYATSRPPEPVRQAVDIDYSDSIDLPSGASGSLPEGRGSHVDFGSQSSSSMPYSFQTADLDLDAEYQRFSTATVVATLEVPVPSSVTFTGHDLLDWLRRHPSRYYKPREISSGLKTNTRTVTTTEVIAAANSLLSVSGIEGIQTLSWTEDTGRAIGYFPED